MEAIKTITYIIIHLLTLLSLYGLYLSWGGGDAGIYLISSLIGCVFIYRHSECSCHQ